MERIKVYIAEGKRPTIFFKGIPDIEEEVLGKKYRIKLLDVKNEKELIKISKDADALITRPGLNITKNSIEALKKCKIISNLAVGYDNIDLDSATANNVVVCNVPDYGTEEVADTTMALLLNLAKKINLYSQNIKYQGTWNWKVGVPQYRLSKRIFGIIGLGRIGSAVAVRAKAFGMKVIFYDPYVKIGIDKVLGVEKIQNLNDLLKKSDFISIHTPLSEETKGMLNEDFFSKVKNDLIFINTARGKLFDSEDTIYNILKNKKISAIGLDVFTSEPPEKESKLIIAWKNSEKWVQDRLILLPHAAFYSNESINEIRRKASTSIKNYFEGNRLDYCLNKILLK